MGKKRIWGIILLALGIMSILGASLNGTFVKMSSGMDLSNIVTVVLMIGLIVVGAVLIITGKKSK